MRPFTVKLEPNNNNITEEWLTKNTSGSDGEYLHHHESCPCDMGKIGKANKLAANKKHSDFYSTPQGMEVKQRNKKRTEEKNEVIARLSEFMKTHGKNTNKAQLEKECIKQLLTRLKSS